MADSILTGTERGFERGAVGRLRPDLGHGLELGQGGGLGFGVGCGAGSDIGGAAGTDLGAGMRDGVRTGPGDRIAGAGGREGSLEKSGTASGHGSSLEDELTRVF
ncbi:hypothetical protein [Palleronia aestuarii]|uniref:hypothetical protein n=1 Tax=Palleronia aestuarii TaxID=568105 RepID=UPI0014749E29|nr:hypothetical protein [Palleronia aestuarii]